MNKLRFWLKKVTRIGEFVLGMGFIIFGASYQILLKFYRTDISPSEFISCMLAIFCGVYLLRRKNERE